MLSIEPELFIYLALLFLFTLFCHALLLINDGMYWDDWLLNVWQKKKQWEIIKRFFSEVGMPILYYQHKYFSFLPKTKYFYNLLGVFSLFISSAIIFIIAIKFVALPTSVAFIIALLMVCYPGQQMGVSRVISLQYIMPMALFYLACFFSLISETTNNSSSILFFVLAIILFLLCFNMNSLLVYYYGFILFLMLFTIQNISVEQFVYFIQGHIVLIILPFIYWIFKEKFTPRYGNYKNYNRIVPRKFSDYLNINIIKKEFFEYSFLSVLSIKNGIISVYLEALKIFFKRFEFFLLGLLMIIPGIIFTYNNYFVLDVTFIQSISIFLFGILLFISASTPYILIKRQLGFRGWLTKNNVLLGLPLSLMVFGFCTILLPENYAIIIITIIVVSNIIYLNYIYLGWVAIGVKYYSLLLNLQKISNIKEYSIFRVYDEHPIQDATDTHPVHDVAYLFYMFDLIWSDKFRLGIYERGKKSEPYTHNEITQFITDSTLDYAMRGVDPNGKQAIIVVTGGPKIFNEEKSAILYMYYKFFQKEGLNSFLLNYSSVEVTEIK